MDGRQDQGHRGYQRLRDGHRQARRACSGAHGPSRQSGGLFPGGGTCRPRPQAVGSVPARGRCRHQAAQGEPAAVVSRTRPHKSHL